MNFFNFDLSQLLSSRNADIQRAALSCLYTYNYKYLMPYRDQLDELMDDKLFRDALVHFGIDETTGVIDALHREGLLPILFRYVLHCDVIRSSIVMSYGIVF